MTKTATFTPAKRGDLIVVQTHHRELGGYDHFQVGVVTNITRDGHVKKWRECTMENPYELDRVTGLIQYWVQPQATVDVEATLKTAAGNPWTHNPEYKGMPYGTLEEVTAMVKQHRH